MSRKTLEETQRISFSDDMSRADSRDNISADSINRNTIDSSQRTSAMQTARMLKNDPKVRNIRKISIIVVLIAASAVSGGVYTGLIQSEEREFESRFGDQSKQVGHGFNSELDTKIRVLHALSVTMTSFAGSQKEQWPFITIPEFSYRAAGAMNVGRAMSIAVYPFISKDQVSRWQNYSVQNQQWVNEVIGFQTEFPDAFRPTSGGYVGHVEGYHGHRSLQNYFSNLDSHSTHGEDHNTNTTHGEDYNSHTNHGEDHNVHTNHGDEDHRSPYTNSSSSNNISEVLFQIVDGDPTTKLSDSKVILPLWQHAPVHPGLPRSNFDASSVERNSEAVHMVMEDNTAVIGKSYELSTSSYGHDLPPINQAFETMTWNEVWEEIEMKSMHSRHHDQHHDHHEGGIYTDHSSHNDPANGLDGPAVNIFYPIFSGLNDDRTVVAVLSLTTKWDSFLLPSLPPDPNGLIVTLHNKCNQSFSFDVTGTEVNYLGKGFHHEAEYEEYEKEFVLTYNNPGFTGIPMANQYCTYTVSVYPSCQMREQFNSGTPLVYTAAVAVVFLFTIFVFTSYDYLVQRRQNHLVESATKSNAIISSLFPKIVRDRLLDDGVPDGSKSGSKVESSRNLGDAGDAPIANFFANTTVMFGDIAGFTAWSSSRQPAEVFTLLETLYAKFDSIAREMKVFKVETIGDCYVAVTGLPNPQEDHHIRMVKFAKRALKSMNSITRMMEVRLGPDTTKLGFRIGLHSGPVTAGVLRGEKSRFQLFGDTVNMASRMESTGKRNHIQLSSSTADLLIALGKENWISKREDMVQAKGKGTVQTYWVKEKVAQLEKKDDSSTDDEDKKSSDFSVARTDSLASGQNGRTPLIDWQVELLSRLIKGIAAKRAGDGNSSYSSTVTTSSSYSYDPRKVLDAHNSMPRDLIAEEVAMPSFEPNSRVSNQSVTFDVELPQMVHDQLLDFVTSIAMLYRENSFHNYEHACHVTMSANKFLTRVVDPNQRSACMTSAKSGEFKDHSYAYGLTGDPLTQFAIIFSALIHDVDHQGVSNKQLNAENNRISLLYGKKSPAEQNSIDLAFEVLGSARYRDLVSYICVDKEELKRLRKLVVNCVMATDIFDKELLAVRNKKWQRAFNSSNQVTSDLKATIVIEHIIQAADVAHTMQHWHVYQKWNERLFVEMCTSYDSGRGPAKDPAEGWYEGELWFFDNYVIPLAKKLEECGVFGVSSDECLNYALENRKEWAIRGKDLVTSMKERYADMKTGKSRRSSG